MKNFNYSTFENATSSFDDEYWRNVSDVEKFKEALRLIELAYELQGKSKNDLRFQRTSFSFQRQED